ncbi:MAG: 30S ribosomal protein S6 [Elusimicrobia bacterium CG_4_10_14_0_2_um_filter_56_8]|nr:MAG: 30S ribosomal protein S6 [Elusimicrobia bacterium CG1_02_56_21]PJA17307.1 MAG: 30S ribosomal protein S6 [Elusimicrobia bacterium CG_4_10_14_0_2_um_filter_56_8]
MTTYELMLIINPQLTDAEVGEAVEKAKKALLDEKGEVLAEDRLGRKKFSHAVGKNRDGFYVYMKVKAAPSSVKGINHTLGLQEAILRSMMIKAKAEPVKKA